MKIMYVIAGMGLSDIMGGSVVRSVEVAKRLQAQGHNIFVVTTTGGYKALSKENLCARYFILRSIDLDKE